MQIIAEMPEEEYRNQAFHAQNIAVQTYSIENNVNQVYSFYMQILKKDD